MKKRTKLMLGMSAMLLAAGGVAATGTFAWYTATAANINYTAITNSVTTVNGVSSLGSFMVTASIDTAPTAVRLTNASGQTYIWDSAHTENRLVTDNGQAMSVVKLDFTITYTGDMNDMEAISDLWDSTISGLSGKVTCSDNTASSTSLTNDQKTRYATIKSTAEGKSANYGLKFGNSSTDYGTAGTRDLAASGTFTGLTFVSKTVTVDKAATVYVGVWGIDGFEQLETDTYEAKFTPKFSV